MERVRGDRNQGHYVCYIHSSLKQAGIISSIPDSPNKYTNSTANSVKAFQQKYGLAFKDGVVDSETKAAFSYVWSSTKESGSYDAAVNRVRSDYKNRPAFLSSVLKYIEAAMLADHVGSAKRGQISRITYTDSKLSPDNITDQFYIAIPDASLGKEIKNIRIKAGAVCGCTIKQIHFTEADYNANLGQANYETLEKDKTKNLISKGAITNIPAGSDATISIDGVKDGHKFKYVRFVIEGSSFNSTGSTTDGTSGGGGTGAVSGNEQVMVSDTVDGWTYDPTKQMVVRVSEAIVKTSVYSTKEQAEKEAGVSGGNSSGAQGDSIINLNTGNFGGRARGIFIDDIKFYGAGIPGAAKTKIRPKEVDTVFGAPVDRVFYLDAKVTRTKTGVNIESQKEKITYNSNDFYKTGTLTVQKFYWKDGGNKNDVTYSAGTTDKIEANSVLDLTKVYKLKIPTTANRFGTIDLNFAGATVDGDVQPTVSGKAVAISGQTPSTSSQFLSYIKITEDIKKVGSSYQIEINYDVDVSTLSSEVSYGADTLLPSSHRHIYASALSSGQNKLNKMSTQNKSSVTYFDGIVCLCDSTGKPVGFPNFNTINVNYVYSANVSPQKITNIYLRKNSENMNSGLYYGFFDLAQKRFLGDNISYEEFLERNGPDNVYIAVLARDFDGNVADNDIDTFGFTSLPPVSDINSPTKMICPIYNLKFKDKTAIKIYQPHNYLSKKSPWYVGISNGSFVKNISLNISQIYNPELTWLKKYVNSTSAQIDLKLLYDTMDQNNYGWSKVLGKPYVDVLEERPIILDNRSIVLRQTPFAVMHEPSDDPDYFGTPTKPFIFIYTKENKNSNWNLVPFSSITSFDFYSGLVELKRGIVPSSDSLIKVNYAVKSNYVPLKVLDGTDVKINPFLYNNSVDFNKPFYFYLQPKNILIQGKEDQQKQNNEIYNNENSIRITQDTRMFDPSHPYFNPLNLVLAVVHVSDSSSIEALEFKDLRLKGGGVSHKAKIVDVLKNNPVIRNYWDIFGSNGMAYNNGGFVIIQLPVEIKQYMTDDSINEIISSALTAGVVYEIQDYNGNDWSKA